MDRQYVTSIHFTSGLHLHGGRFSWPGQAAVDVEQMRAEASSRIRSMSEKYMPLFTKEAIRDVYQQIKASKPGDKISVKRLDGVVVDFDVETGSISDCDPEYQYLVTTPCIYYRSMQDLIAFRDDSDDDMVYCNLQISHNTSLQHRITKELVHSFRVKPQDEVKERFRAGVEAWEGSETCKQLRSILKSTIQNNNAPEISKVIGIGCGAISRDEEDEFVRPSISQHALLLTMQDVLSTNNKSGDRVKCYAQEPVYSKVDRLVLEDSGISILEDPEAWLEVDESSAVFSCGPDVPARQIISDVAQPAMMIWDNPRR